jgi:hypothetical protein
VWFIGKAWFIIVKVVVRIHIVIQHISLTYHTHIHTQTHNMDENIHKYPCTTTENVTKKIYYHDANIYSQTKPTPLRESKPMLTGHHSSEPTNSNYSQCSRFNSKNYVLWALSHAIPTLTTWGWVLPKKSLSSNPKLGNPK